MQNREISIFEQTAILLEFRTEVNEKLDTITENIDYLMHKEQLNEKEIFTLKQKFKKVQ